MEAMSAKCVTCGCVMWRGVVCPAFVVATVLGALFGWLYVIALSGWLR
jgi:hypothetical protein